MTYLFDRTDEIPTKINRTVDGDDEGLKQNVHFIIKNGGNVQNDAAHDFK